MGLQTLDRQFGCIGGVEGGLAVPDSVTRELVRDVQKNIEQCRTMIDALPTNPKELLRALDTLLCAGLLRTGLIEDDIAQQFFQDQSELFENVLERMNQIGETITMALARDAAGNGTRHPVKGTNLAKLLAPFMRCEFSPELEQSIKPFNTLYDAMSLLVRDVNRLIEHCGPNRTRFEELSQSLQRCLGETFKQYKPDIDSVAGLITKRTPASTSVLPEMVHARNDRVVQAILELEKNCGPVLEQIETDLPMIIAVLVASKSPQLATNQAPPVLEVVTDLNVRVKEDPEAIKVAARAEALHSYAVLKLEEHTLRQGSPNEVAAIHERAISALRDADDFRLERLERRLLRAAKEGNWAGAELTAALSGLPGDLAEINPHLKATASVSYSPEKLDELRLCLDCLKDLGLNLDSDTQANLELADSIEVGKLELVIAEIQKHALPQQLFALLYQDFPTIFRWEDDKIKATLHEFAVEVLRAQGLGLNLEEISCYSKLKSDCSSKTK